MIKIKVQLNFFKLLFLTQYLITMTLSSWNIESPYKICHFYEVKSIQNVNYPEQVFAVCKLQTRKSQQFR